MTALNLDSYPLVYRGSVKNLYQVKEAKGDTPGIYLFQFTDDYSIFDYGKMPDTLEGKGAALTLMAANIFERLEDPSEWQSLATSPVWGKIEDTDVRRRLLDSSTLSRLKKDGFKTHYRGVRDASGRLVKTSDLREPTTLMEVASVRIIRPQRLMENGNLRWDYSAIFRGLKNYLVPLENIFRFGLPKGSSLLERFAKNPDYAKTLGLKKPAAEGSWLPRPVMEFSTKLEPGDRYMMPEEAQRISGLEGQEFQDLQELTFLVALFLMHLFSKVGVELWDGKVEFLKTDRLVMGDSVTPDELRLLKNGVQISKEPLRQYYKKFQPDFVEKIMKSKKIAGQTNRAIAQVLREDFGCQPERLQGDFKKTFTSMYVALSPEITGLTLFPHCPSLDAVIGQLKDLS